jgi:hypothetical protein
MPNWVYNNLTIAPNAEAGGTIKDVADAIEQLGKSYTVKTYDWKSGEVSDHTVENPEFSFWNVVRPEGEELQKYDESHGAGGAMPFWYEWNCEHWGTKWDASEVEFHDYEPDHKRFTFSTPWSPPIPVLTELSAQHPNLHIELEWEEEQGFGGTFVFRGGEFTETNYYDIPNSHADYVERDKEEQCICSWGDEDSFFSDCPSAVKNEYWISPDELEIEVMI